MAGSLLGPDQVKRINAVFPALVAHVRTLLVADHTAVGLMRAHLMVETFDSDHMASLFRDLSFISPLEKRALVRAALYELIVTDANLFISPVVQAPITTPRAPEAKAEPKVFTPAQFNLNVNRSAEFHGQAPADTPAPAPVVTSTHTPDVAKRLEQGKKELSTQQAKLDAAVAKLREAATPQPIAAVPDEPVEE